MNSQANTNSALVTNNNITKLSSDFINCSPFDLAIKCLVLSTIEGLDNVEKYIKSTFFKQESDSLISIMNLITNSYNK